MKKIYILIFIIFSCNKIEDLPNSSIQYPEIGKIIPHVQINTLNKEIVDEPKISSKMIITKDSIILYDGNIGIEYRGSSSQLFDKKSYGFETWDEENEDMDYPLLGFPEEEDWIFYGPYSDKTLIRNKLIYDLSNQIGRYASRTKFCELTINNQYMGVYVFMEKLKRDKNRIAIKKLENDDLDSINISGGYIIKIDKSDDENGEQVYNDFNAFISNYKPNYATYQSIWFNYEYPKPKDIHNEQKQYINSYFDNFEKALSGINFKDSLSGYRKYIDVGSFIDFFILNELSNNLDGYRLSTYLHKNRNEKLKIGPIWDFNLSFGNGNYCNGDKYDIWTYKFNETCSDDFWLIPFWWEKLLEDPYFVNKLKERWNELRKKELSDENIFQMIQNYISILKNESGAVYRNYSKWNVIGKYLWPNNYVGNSYESEIDYLIKWISKRNNWLDKSINEL
tara:strand:- start:874 stop:2226 length:1353 start_codon:yes stop_codon:yes gene_type:complete